MTAAVGSGGGEEGRIETRGDLRPPPGSGRLGVVVLLVSLGALFAAGIVAYWVARARGLGSRLAEGATIERIELPLWFWISTFVILVSSAFLHYAQVSARVDHPRRSRRALLVTTLLGYLFLVLQIPGLIQVVSRHRAVADQHLLYGVVLFLAVLHALHVIGGLFPLTLLAARSSRVPLDSEAAGAIAKVALYWHFLAIVWLVMFNTFLLAG